ncbi:hypothetical protein [Faecalibacillus intestinalis]
MEWIQRMNNIEEMIHEMIKGTDLQLKKMIFMKK